MAKERRKVGGKAKPAANPWPGRLRALRAKLGTDGKLLPQAEAAARIGCSQNLWSAWERGTRTPDGSRQILIQLLESGKLAK